MLLLLVVGVVLVVVVVLLLLVAWLLLLLLPLLLLPLPLLLLLLLLQRPVYNCLPSCGGLLHHACLPLAGSCIWPALVGGARLQPLNALRAGVHALLPASSAPNPPVLTACHLLCPPARPAARPGRLVGR